MKTLKNPLKSQQADIIILVSLWCLSIVRDRLWIHLDRAIPAWDQTHHLTGTLNYFQALQNPAFLSGEWWQNLWMLSSKNPPLTYILGAGIQGIFGRGEDQALWLMPLFSAILVITVYHLGNFLFERPVGLFAGIIVLIIPGLYRYPLQFLLDYPLTTIVIAAFASLVFWQEAKTPQKQWQWAIVWGICLGCAFMIKQGALFFLFFPLIILNGHNLIRRRWRRIAQAIIAFILAGIILIPWYSTNWIYVIGNYQQGIVQAGAKEGDPTWQTLAGWWYYPARLADTFTLPLIVVAVGGILLYCWRKAEVSGGKWGYIAIYLLPAYIIATIFANKDIRYIMPAFPMLAIVLAWGLTLWPQKWRIVRWGIVAVVSFLMLVNLFPVGITWGVATPFYPYQQSAYPHPEVVAAITKATPHLRANVGVMPSTGQLNHNNFNYYGALADFQVYGREVGVRERNLIQDARSLDWYITKTGNLGAVGEIQTQMIQRLESDADLTLYRTWELPDNSLLKLYHRTNAPIQVEATQIQSDRVQLNTVIIPDIAPPGQPLPVTYEWTGNWDDLQAGVVLLTWQSTAHPNAQWWHDRGLGNGRLYGKLSGSAKIREQVATLPPADLPPGQYALEATYLNRETGETYPLEVGDVTVTIAPDAPAVAAPEVDLVTQLRQLAAQLPQGIEALTPVFDEIGRINQYDPVQDYVQQGEVALRYRLQQNPKNTDAAYALAFTQILQEDARGAIAALQTVTQLDPENPFAHAYLAFVYLYTGQPHAAEIALKPALARRPDLLEFKALAGLSALMQGKVSQAWGILSPLWSEI